MRYQRLAVLKQRWATLFSPTASRLATAMLEPEVHMMQLVSADGATHMVHKDRERLVSAGLLTPLLYAYDGQTPTEPVIVAV